MRIDKGLLIQIIKMHRQHCTLLSDDSAACALKSFSEKIMPTAARVRWLDKKTPQPRRFSQAYPRR